MKSDQWWFEQGRLYAELLKEFERLCEENKILNLQILKYEVKKKKEVSKEFERLREENKILRLKYEVKKKKEVSNGTDD